MLAPCDSPARMLVTASPEDKETLMGAILLAAKKR
jgi:hypothetical protein